MGCMCLTGSVVALPALEFHGLKLIWNSSTAGSCAGITQATLAHACAVPVNCRVDLRHPYSDHLVSGSTPHPLFPTQGSKDTADKGGGKKKKGPKDVFASADDYADLIEQIERQQQQAQEGGEGGGDDEGGGGAKRKQQGGKQKGGAQKQRGGGKQRGRG